MIPKITRDCLCWKQELALPIKWVGLKVDFLGCGSGRFQTDTSASSRRGLQDAEGYLLIDIIGIYCKYFKK